MTLLLEDIYKLQIIDSDIIDSVKLLSDIKYKISDKKELSSLEDKLAKNTISFKKHQEMKKTIELEVTSIQENINLINQKIYGGSIKNSKELIALDGEKGFLEEKLSLNEDKLLNIMIKTDSLQTHINSLNMKIVEVTNKKQSEMPELIKEEKKIVN